ncbi:hypothetical protein AVEN_172410-1 [Araneus ventricosus]|uniref:Uncharacterized protein n=1 Tax=Araneus ventricosus TaxID=182803 RepID=A0A4Y1ZSR6_ARAVE|nr:hypothetical protein AVEN_16473-1 [Araneus ventricosus]GBL65993.1 hypothetical protein AVEN_34303-1 [Araneus ventricosus]GBL66014.1 hypothetical protein AVEN_158557-1 [Araneus ventricosus]GBL66019.1 hypothetical protein AVEN_172410-1 [Araneus ventricosus]
MSLPRWPSGKVSGPGKSQVRNPIPLKIRRLWGMLHVKSYVVFKRRPAGVVRKLREGACRLKCRPRHLTVVQNYEACLKNSPRAASKL